MVKVLVYFTVSGIETAIADYSVLKNEVIQKGEKGVLFALGCMVPVALKAAEIYKKRTGKDITVVNPRFLNGLDIELLDSLQKDHKLVVTIEDGELDGGYGERIACRMWYQRRKIGWILLRSIGTDVKFTHLLPIRPKQIESISEKSVQGVEESDIFSRLSMTDYKWAD